MRKLLGFMVLAAVAAILPPSASSAYAQCAVGCVSSSSCEGNGKGSCRALCDTKGNCGCADSECGTALAPVVFAPSAALLLVRVEDPQAEQPATASLLVDCHGNVLDVRLSRMDGNPYFGELSAIRLERPRADPAGRLAARE